MPYISIKNFARIMKYFRTKFVAPKAKECAGNAATADRATSDGDGKNIARTYLKNGGGTMTGSIVMQNTDVASKTVKPTESQYREISFCTDDGVEIANRYATISSSVSNNGVTGISLRVYKFADKDTSSDSIGIFNDNGTVYTSAPTPDEKDNSNKIATTAFVNLAIEKALEGFSNGDSKTY